MNKLLYVLILCVLQLSAAGQYRVSGKVTTAAGKAVSYANVFIFSPADSSLLKGGMAGESGEFRISNISSRQFFVRYSATGYKTYTSGTIEITGATEKDLGVQVMEDSSQQLQDAVVRAVKPMYQRRPDGMVVNVENSVLTKGSTVLQVLERSPGIYIDRQNGNISLNGKNGVLVMLDGKLMRLSIAEVVALLNSMSADDIEKVELLTTPPAKYDAEGSAGMINIVRKRSSRPGTTGSLSLTTGYGWGEKEAASINAQHTGRVIYLFGSYAFNHDRSFSDWYAAGTQNVPVMGGKQHFDFWNRTEPVSNNHNAMLGIEGKLSPKTVLGAVVNYNNSSFNSQTTNTAIYHIEPDSLLYLNADITGHNHWTNSISSLYLDKTLSAGEKLLFDADYLRFTNDNPSDVRTTFTGKNGNVLAGNDSTFSAPVQRSLANTLIQVGVGKIDYSKQAGKTVKIEAGIKGTYTHSTSVSSIESLDNGTWVNTLGVTNNIVMKETIGAGYVSSSWQIDPSFNVVAGVRYEYSHTKMDSAAKGQTIIDRHLGVIFPNLLLTKKLNDNSELQLSYSKRIARPSYNDLASFVNYNDPISVYTGNPALQPTITNNIKAGYNIKGYSFSLLFSRDDYPIVRYQVTPDPSGKYIYILPENLKYENFITFQTNLPFKVTDWWNMNYGFSGGFRQYKLMHTEDKVVKSYFGFSAYGSQTFRLPWKSTLEISGWFNGISYEGTKRNGAVGAVDMGIKKQLDHDGGSFQLTVSDVFRTMRFSNSFGAVTREAFDLQSHLSYHVETISATVVRLTYSRPFGHAVQGSSHKQDNSSSEESGRIRK